jgi:hypothetical protein
MVSFTLTYDKDVIDALRAKVANAPRSLAIFAEKTVPALIRKELTPLVTEPRAPSLPFVWSNDPVKNAKARRWYFANKVKGKGGGRYVRTHGLVNNWKVEAAATGSGAILTVSNSTPGLDYVQGPKQVPSHHDSGWAQYDDVLLKAEQKANDIVIDYWLNAVVVKG